MKRFRLIHSGFANVPSETVTQYDVCLATLIHQDIPHTQEYDVKAVVQQRQGKFRPKSGAFIIVHGDDLVGYDIFALCKYIEANGLKLC